MLQSQIEVICDICGAELEAGVSQKRNRHDNRVYDFSDLELVLTVEGCACLTKRIDELDEIG